MCPTAGSHRLLGAQGLPASVSGRRFRKPAPTFGARRATNPVAGAVVMRPSLRSASPLCTSKTPGHTSAPRAARACAGLTSLPCTATTVAGGRLRPMAGKCACGTGPRPGLRPAVSTHRADRETSDGRFAIPSRAAGVDPWAAGAGCLGFRGMPAARADLLVGTATAEITPSGPVALRGQFHLRISQAVETPLVANVLAIESREHGRQVDAAVFVACDVVVIEHTVRDMVRQAVKQRIAGLDPRKVVLTATHTHTGPTLVEGQYQLPDQGVTPIAEYRRFSARKCQLHLGTEPRGGGLQPAGGLCRRFRPHVWGHQPAGLSQSGRLRRPRHRHSVLLEPAGQADGHRGQCSVSGPGSGKPLGGQCRFLASGARVAPRPLRPAGVCAGLDQCGGRPVAPLDVSPSGRREDAAVARAVAPGGDRPADHQRRERSLRTR